MYCISDFLMWPSLSSTCLLIPPHLVLTLADGRTGVVHFWNGWRKPSYTSLFSPGITACHISLHEAWVEAVHVSITIFPLTLSYFFLLWYCSTLEVVLVSQMSMLSYWNALFFPYFLKSTYDNCIVHERKIINSFSSKYFLSIVFESMMVLYFQMLLVFILLEIIILR